MDSVLEKNIVLVLNRNWQAINIITPAEALCHMFTDTATALEIRGKDYMLPTKWEEWLELPVTEGDWSIRTVDGAIRVPTVIVLSRFAKVPIKRPKLSARNIRERDGNRCQYTGKVLGPEEGNIDHVMPRSRGGATSWKNCVLASKNINSKKANRTPAEAGLRLVRKPVAPKAVPVTMTLKNPHNIEDWEIFLGKKTS